MAYAILAEGRGADELEELDAQIGMAENPEEAAMEALRQHQAEMGMEISTGKPEWDPDVDEEFR